MFFFLFCSSYTQKSGSSWVECVCVCVCVLIRSFARSESLLTLPQSGATLLHNYASFFFFYFCPTIICANCSAPEYLVLALLFNFNLPTNQGALYSLQSFSLLFFTKKNQNCSVELSQFPSNFNCSSSRQSTEFAKQKKKKYHKNFKRRHI